ncbi:MAG: hypothetical protein IGS39_03945 [Calothrix sp. C42_A2020_038]|nr:hypothetical protein [Calothrix sp. C42_A2020_038]
MLDITLQNSIVEAGKPVFGQVSLQPNQSSAQSVTIKLNLHTKGQGSKDKQTVVTLELGQLYPGSSLSFQCDIPYEGPISFHGKLFQLTWEITAEIKAGLFGGKSQTAPIRVVPRNRIVKLQP